MHILTKTYKPCHNRVLVRFVKKAGSDIILPDGKTIGDRTIVENIGPDVKCCQTGDEVVISSKADLIGVDESEKLVVVLDTDIVALVQE